MDKKTLSRITGQAMKCEGQTTRAELAVLATLAAAVPSNQVIVEIGSYMGRSTVALALGSLAGNSVRVYAIDPHESFVGAKGGVFGPQDMELLYVNLIRAGVGRTVAAVCLPAAEVAAGWTKSVGLWFHDGDHREAALRRDLENWWQHIAINGKLVFHDSSSPGVMRVLNGLCSIECYNCLEIRGVEREITWFHKRA